MAKSIMILSSTAGAGKSFFAAAICRIFAEDGYKTAPFKIQSVTSEVSVSQDGLEISSDIALLAAASLKSTESRMNPVVLEPCGCGKFDVTVMGSLLGEMTEKEYALAYPDFEDKVYEAYESLLFENDIVVVEADGNPAEPDAISQNSLSFARRFKIPIILVSDFETGCAFSSAYGVFAFMDADLRELLKGFLINKAGGLFLNGEDNLEKLEEFTEVPFVGILPLADLKAPLEDLPVYARDSGSIAEETAPLTTQNYENIEDIEDMFPSFEAGSDHKAPETHSADVQGIVEGYPGKIETDSNDRFTVSTVEELEEEIAILKASIEKEEAEDKAGLLKSIADPVGVNKQRFKAPVVEGYERDEEAAALKAGEEDFVPSLSEQKAENVIITENNAADNVSPLSDPVSGKGVHGGVEAQAQSDIGDHISDMPAGEKKANIPPGVQVFNASVKEEVSSSLEDDSAVSAAEELDRILAMESGGTDKKDEDAIIFTEGEGFGGVNESEGGSSFAKDESPFLNSSTIADKNIGGAAFVHSETGDRGGENKDVLDDGRSAYTEDKENQGDIFSFGDIFESEIENVPGDDYIASNGASSNRNSFKNVAPEEYPANEEVRSQLNTDKSIQADSSVKNAAIPEDSKENVYRGNVRKTGGIDKKREEPAKTSSKTRGVSEQTDKAQATKAPENQKPKVLGGAPSIATGGATATKVSHDPDKVNVTVITLPHMTHGAALKFLRDDTMSVVYCDGLENFGEPDIVLLPDTLKPISDFLWMKGNGLEKAVRNFAGSNGMLLGICGGYHMLFEAIADPYKMETGGETSGFGFFKAKTSLGKDRKISKARGIFKSFEGVFSGFNGKNFEGWYVQSARISRSNHKHIAVIIDQNTGLAKQDGLYNKNVFGMDVSGFLENPELKELMIDVLTRFKQARKAEAGKIMAFAEKGEAKLSIDPLEASEINEKLAAEETARKGDVSGDLSEPEGILNEEDYIFGVPKGYAGFSTSNTGDTAGIDSNSYDFYDQEDDHYILAASRGSAADEETLGAKRNVLDAQDIPAVAQIVRRSVDMRKIYDIIDKKALK